MRVVTDIPDELVDDIRAAIRSGGYEGPDEFLEQALRTQLKLESAEEQSLPTFGEAIEASESDTADRASLEESSSRDTSVDDTEPRNGLEDLSVHSFEITTVASPNPERIDTGPLWGQYNRIFPMKLSVRRLAIVLSEEGDTTPYGRFRDETAQTAREYGLRLEEIDDEKGRGRGEKFSAALPTGDKVERSLERFKTHFVGQLDSTGALTGSLPTLGFVDIDPDTEEFGLTDAGLAFAELENPLLDESLQSDASLSDEERQFYLNHVRTEHPAEAEAMELVATAVRDGINRPDPLSEEVGTLSDEWSAAQASTVRSGLIGRMYELGLVTRQRVGARGIGYELTQRGEQQLL